MLKHAKKLLCLLLCCSIGICLLNNIPVNSYASISDFDKQIEELEAQKAENEKNIQDLRDQLEQTSSDISKEKEYQTALEEKIKLQEDNLAITKDMIDVLNEKISSLEEDIASLENDIAEKEAEVQKDMEEFKLRLRAMYITGDDSLASVLSGSTDFYDILAKTELVARLIQYDQELFDKLSEEIENLNQSKAQLENDKNLLEYDLADLEVTKKEYETDLAELNDDYAKTDYIIDMLEQAEQEWQNQIENTEYDQAAIDAEIDRITKEKQEAIRAEEERKRQAAAQSGTSYTASYTYTGEAFLWPAGNYVYISSGYGYRWGSLHGGIDISGTGIHYQPAYAAADGMVITASETCTHDYGGFCGCGMSYGNYVIIDHGADDTGTSYATLYGHLASLNVSEGQIVKRGDIIGYIGSTGNSTGYHLHFEVRKNGTRVNPMDYFDRT